MDPVEIFLITIAAIFVIGVGGEVVFARTGIPDVLWLIVVGVLVGPVFGLVERDALARVAPYFGALTLVVVLFNGGTQLRLGDLMRSAPRATLLAVLSFAMSMVGVAATAAVAAWVGLLPAEWTWLHGAMFGAILGGSSSVVIMPAMERARLDPGISNLVNLESALTDILCVVVTGALITVATSGAIESGTVWTALGRAFGFGFAAGALAGLAWILLQPLFSGSEHEYPVTLGALLVLYVVVGRSGGSSAFAILTAAVLVGNAPGISRRIGLIRQVSLDRAMQSFHARLAFIIKSFFFTFIGAMLRPPWALIVLGATVGVVLLAVRAPVVWISTAGAGLSRDARRLVTMLLPRGMAAGVLAMMPHQAGVPGTATIPVAAFAAVVTTIVMFAFGFAVLKRRLGSVLPVNEEALPEVPTKQ